jgi:hypothetical protein
MHYDIQEYNKQIVSSEQQMLLYNVGRLNRELPPHFMMLSSVSQTRMFSGSLSFQWTQMLNALMPSTTIINATKMTTRTTTAANVAEGGAWEAGPFAAGTIENPTITFVPIQGQDFYNRFESPLTNQFSLFVEDLSDFAPREQLAELVNLFAESLDLTHGDSGACKRGRYFNRPQVPQDLKFPNPDPYYYSSDFSPCVKEITNTPILDRELIDGHHKIPTKTSEDPKALDVVTALGAGYEWAKFDDKFALTNPVKIHAWFDYVPNFVEAPGSKPKPNEPLPPIWSQDEPPDGKELVYFSPKGYQWKVYKVNKNKSYGKSDRKYALVPDGYDLVRDENGVLRTDQQGEFIPRKLATHLASGTRTVNHLASGTRTKDDPVITRTDGILAEDVGCGIAGSGIPPNTTIVAVDPVKKTATMSDQAIRNSSDDMTVGDVAQSSSVITRTDGILAEDVGSGIAGMGIPSGTTIVAVDPIKKTATISNRARRCSTESMSVGDLGQFSYADFSYADDVVQDLWPAPYDDVYVELRKNGTDNAGRAVDDAAAKRLCFSKPDNLDQTDLVCGYFKIGNLLGIMQRLAVMACRYDDPKEIEKNCEQSTFGIGPLVPLWADTSASFTYADGSESVWVPAHDPNTDPDLAERDRRMFFLLYKLYQMSLVDTTKLVTGAPPITISK